MGLFSRNKSILDRLKKSLNIKDSELKERLDEFNVIKDQYAKQPFDLISMNSLFDFYGIEYNDDIVFNLLRKDS